MPKVSLSSQTAEREPESSKTDPEPHPEPQPSPSPTPEKRTVTDPSAALAELGRHLSQARDPDVAALQRARGEKGWVHLTSSGFSPNDTEVSLHRQFAGKISARRSDGILVTISVPTRRTGDPSRIGVDLVSAFQRLEEYRVCACTPTVPCTAHVQERMAAARG